MSQEHATLLVVDDNEDNRYTLTRRLKREGYAEVLTANDGIQALQLLKDRPVDLVLLDIMMPGLDGFQVLAQLKADAQLRDVPVIMISALEELASVVRCIELGAEDYLPKPFNPTLLKARVGASLEKKRLRDQVRSSLSRLERELEAARALQLGMLPVTFPQVTAAQPVQVHAVMDPAREVGGDLYDAFYTPDGVFCFLVGDVSGKGAAAAMFMARARSLVRLAMVELRPRLGPDERAPSYVAEAVNRELFLNNRERMFMTLFLGFLDIRSGQLTYINAGHPAPYLLRGDGRIDRLPGTPQAPLAVRAATRYNNHAMTLEVGDGLFVATDGVVEAMNSGGELYSSARLEQQLQRAVHAAPQDLVQGLKRDIDAFTGNAPKADDVTMMAVRRCRAAEPAAVPASADGAPARASITELVLPNEPAAMAAARDAMAQLGAQHGLAARPLHQLQVALDELVSNVVKYAWPEGGRHELRVRISVGSGQVEIEISDDGRMFDPLQAPPPQAPPPGQRPMPGGRGIHMLRQILDRIEYARVDGHNRLTLSKRCSVGAGNDKETNPLKGEEG